MRFLRQLAVVVLVALCVVAVIVMGVVVHRLQHP